ELNYQKTLLRLYDDEIIRRLAANHSKLDDLSPLVQYGEVERLRQRHKFNWILFGEQLWELLFNAPTHTALYDSVLAFLHRCEGESALHRRLCLLFEQGRRRDILPILRRIDDFLNIMDPSIVCEYLSSFSERHKRILLPVYEALRKKGTLAAKKRILRSLPELGRDASFDFLQAIVTCGEDGKNLVNDICPNFQQLYQLLLSDRRENYRRGVVYYVSPHTPLATVIESCGQSDPNPFRIDLNVECLPPPEAEQFMDDIIDALYDEDVIPLRCYQEELAEPAYEGHNTVVCAPTGSGKTVVAASVIRQHLIQGKLTNMPNKVCFLVTNTTFLSQQAELLQGFLRGRWRIAALSGTTGADVPLVQTFHSKDVIVITPQMIVNLLNGRSTTDESMPFSLTMFSLIVFDEAHHADEKHPYNEIMIAYHDLKRTGAFPKSERLPQVIGLTASLGVGRAKNEVEAQSHIIKMCANLDAHMLSRVRVNVSELRNYSKVAVDEIKFVDSTHMGSRIYIAVDHLMDAFEKRLSDSKCNLFDSIPKTRDTQAYENWFEKLLSHIIPEMKVEQDIRLFLTETLQYIKVLYLTQQLCAHFPGNIAQDYLREELERLSRSASFECRQLIDNSEVLRPLPKRDCSNRLYETLIQEIRKEFLAKPDGRAIVFVSTREFACRLRDAINADDSLSDIGIMSEAVTGINASTEEGGQNVNVQREKLMQFANGDVKVLCATSVAEEGIDIQKCTLVIKYNYATNEIAHVQRRGRGRAEGSRCVLLTHDSSLEKRENDNLTRERLMNIALEAIDRKPKDWFRREVENCIETMHQERQRARALMGEQQRRIADNVYDLRCRKCDTLICSSTHIVTDRNRSHYICVDEEIWSRVGCTEYPVEKKQQEKGFEMAALGSHHCIRESCSLPWGRIVKINGVVLAVIRVEAFVLVSQTKERFCFRKWKKVVEGHFTPREISTYDYAVMKRAPMQPEYADAV
uniref:RNA helicase n=1 Tax=Parascaris univalens TaxID=6257 RepID=A0A915AW39_PARUN